MSTGMIVGEPHRRVPRVTVTTTTTTKDGSSSSLLFEGSRSSIIPGSPGPGVVVVDDDSQKISLKDDDDDDDEGRKKRKSRNVFFLWWIRNKNFLLGGRRRRRRRRRMKIFNNKFSAKMKYYVIVAGCCFTFLFVIIYFIFNNNKKFRMMMMMMKVDDISVSSTGSSKKPTTTKAVTRNENNNNNLLRILIPSKGRRTSQDLPISILIHRINISNNKKKTTGSSTKNSFFGGLPDAKLSDQTPDYANLIFEPGEVRKIKHGYKEGVKYEKETKKKKEKKEKKKKKKGPSSYLNHYFAFDDDYRKGYNDVTEEHTCRRNSFHRLHYPSCNKFHEINMLYDSGRYVSRGHFRVVWKVESTTRDDDDDEDPPAILKVLRLKKNRHEFDHDFFEMTRMDALVMTLLTSSPRIVDIYGHCGASVMTERMVKEVEQYVVPGSGYAYQSDLNDLQNVNPRNSFTVDEKLQMALEMAESLADLHGYKNGVIVHDDVQLCQWLLDKNGNMKLNDFNRAEFMLWNDEEQEYCRYRNGRVYGNYRSPEEDADEPLNEKIDIYSLGNNMYGLLTGLWVYYENEDDEVVQRSVMKGILPYIDPRYRTRSYGEGALVQIMERCWEFDPDKRASVFEIVDFLRDAIAENNNNKRRDEAAREYYANPKTKDNNNNKNKVRRRKDKIKKNMAAAKR